MIKLPQSKWHKAWIIPPVILGIAVLLFMKSGKQPPAQIAEQEVTRHVRIIEAPVVDLVPQAEGYGIVQPAQKWTAVAQVTGRIIETHPRLRNGEIIEQGTLLFKIDPVDYDLDVATANAQLAELEVQEKNARASLAIEQRNRLVANRELSRLGKLAKKGTTSQSSVDEAERAALNSEAVEQNLENTIALIPAQRKKLEAQLAQAKRDLDNTVVVAPFNLRIASLNIETAQFVTQGQNLFEGDSVDRVEIVTQVPISSLRNLFIGRENTLNSIAQISQNLNEFTGFKPRLELDMGGHTASWAAEFVRFTDNVDTQTRTIGIVVAVDKPMEKIKPGYRPPLSKGMFVRVILQGHVQPGRIIIPRSAIRNGKAYIMTADKRLEQRDIEVLFSQEQISVIKSGIKPHETVVVSDLIPAIDGRLLEPETDIKLQQQLTNKADKEDAS